MPGYCAGCGGEININRGFVYVLTAFPKGIDGEEDEDEQIYFCHDCGKKMWKETCYYCNKALDLDNYLTDAFGYKYCSEECKANACIIGCAKCGAELDTDEDEHYALLHCPRGLRDTGGPYQLYCAECGKKSWESSRKETR